MNINSATYPEGWTEQQRADAEAALSWADRGALLQELETPPDFWAAVEAMWEPELDVCASVVNAKTNVFWTREENSLEGVRWFVPGQDYRVAWCNPGFKNVLPWHQKAHREAQEPGATVLVLGLPGASQCWWQFAFEHAAEIIFLRPRVQFLTPWPLRQMSNPRESVLFVYRRRVGDGAPRVATWEWKEGTTYG